MSYLQDHNCCRHCLRLLQDVNRASKDFKKCCGVQYKIFQPPKDKSDDLGSTPRWDFAPPAGFSRQEEWSAAHDETLRAKSDLDAAKTAQQAHSDSDRNIRKVVNRLIDIGQKLTAERNHREEGEIDSFRMRVHTLQDGIKNAPTTLKGADLDAFLEQKGAELRKLLRERCPEPCSVDGVCLIVQDDMTSLDIPGSTHHFAR